MSVKDRQDRLRNIAEVIESEEPLSVADRDFIVQALRDIADGVDAKQALNVKAKRGERTSKASKTLKLEGKIGKALAIGWIAAAKRPIEQDGLGLTYDQAFQLLRSLNKRGSMFGFAEETLKTYWNKNSTSRKSQTFKIPD